MARWYPEDPGKRVDAHLPTPEWKALAQLAERYGWSIKSTVRWAIAETVDNETRVRSKYDCDTIEAVLTVARRTMAEAQRMGLKVGSLRETIEAIEAMRFATEDR